MEDSRDTSWSTTHRYLIECELLSSGKSEQVADNSRVYLQGDEKPPKGVAVHPGIKDPAAKWYESDDRANTITRYVPDTIKDFLKSGDFEWRKPCENRRENARATYHNKFLESLRDIGLLIETEYNKYKLSGDGNAALNSSHKNIVSLHRLGWEMMLRTIPVPKGEIVYQSLSDDRYEVEDYKSSNAILMYKEFGYTGINNGVLYQSSNAEILDSIAHLDALLDRCVMKEPLTLYNGCPQNVASLLTSGEYKEGDVFQLDTFTSMTDSLWGTHGFLNRSESDPSAGKVVIEMDQPANSKGYYYGKRDKEHEVLLPRGTQVLLTGKRYETIDGETITVITCKRLSGILPSDTKPTVQWHHESDFQ
jgi:hypothetical protein